MLDKKADLASPIIMWMAILVVAIIVITWFSTNIRPLTGISAQIDYDLRQIFIYTDTGCISSYYTARYNPRTNQGNIYINESKVCIETKDMSGCTELTCPISNYFEADLAKIINLEFNKTPTNFTVSAEEFIR